MTTDNFSLQDLRTDLDADRRRLGSSLSRVAAATAAAFLSTEAVMASDWSMVPRLPDLGVLRCSQRNVGERHEMICNMSVEKKEWNLLLGNPGDEEFSADAFCELANCICGGLTAEASITDEFGYLIPCVPYAGHSRIPDASRAYRGAFRLGGAWVHFSIAIREGVRSGNRESTLAA